MIRHAEETNEAVRLLSRGATPGMVENVLEKKGLGSGPRAEVMESAKRIVNFRARVKHFGIGTVGLFILAAGGYLLTLQFANRNLLSKIPGIIMFSGLIVTMYGFYSATRNQV